LSIPLMMTCMHINWSIPLQSCELWMKGKQVAYYGLRCVIRLIGSWSKLVLFGFACSVRLFYVPAMIDSYYPSPQLGELRLILRTFFLSMKMIQIASEQIVSWEHTGVLMHSTPAPTHLLQLFELDILLQRACSLQHLSHLHPLTRRRFPVVTRIRLPT